MNSADTSRLLLIAVVDVELNFKLLTSHKRTVRRVALSIHVGMPRGSRRGMTSRGGEWTS